MSGYIAESTIDQVRHASDIVEIIGAAIPLKRAGASFKALCPFHNEKTPSFHVNPQRQTFHCFGCHKGGNVFTFLMEFEGVDFPEAVRRLAERSGIPMEFDNDPQRQQERSLKETLLQIHEQITQRWHNFLVNDAGGQIARDYLAKRGVSDASIRAFRLGCAPEAWDDTVNWAKGKGYDLASMEKAGLVLRKEGGDRFYDRFRGRLMFPIRDEQGRVIGFSGRVLRGDEKAAKYVNSPETPIFIKSKVMYGLDLARRPMLEADSAIVCEGQLDLIACVAAGIQNVVAPQGTAFGAGHAAILKRYVSEVVLCFDADPAGQSAAIRALDDLLASGLAIRVATVPAPHDPDSFIQEQGAEAFRELIRQAPGFFDYYLRYLTGNHDPGTDKGRLAILQFMGEALRKTGNEVLIDGYAQKTAIELRVSPESVRAEFKRIRPKSFRTVSEEAKEEIVTPRPSKQEFWLLKLLFAEDEAAGWATAHLNPEWIQHELVRRIVELRFDQENQGEWSSVDAMLDVLEDREAVNLLSEAVTEKYEIPDPSRQLQDLTLRLRNQFIDRQLPALAHKASRPDCPEEELHNFIQQQHALRELKRKPLQSLRPNPDDF